MKNSSFKEKKGSFTPKLEYTCQSCGKTFISIGKDGKNKELLCEVGVKPVCSSNCEFKIIYKLVTLCEFSNENLIKMLRLKGVLIKKEEFNRNTALFEITKHYAKIGLSNIKAIFFKEFNGSVQFSSAQKRTAQLNKCLSNKTFELKVEPNNKSKEELSEWF